MDAALFCIGIRFPPPSPCTDIFAWCDGSSTWCAAQTGIPFVVQFVIGDVICINEIAYLLELPVGERVDLVIVMDRVPFNDVY